MELQSYRTTGQGKLTGSRVSKISGDFPVKCKMERILGVNKRRFSDYAKKNHFFSPLFESIGGISPSI
jgi:hypothetical protein